MQPRVNAEEVKNLSDVRHGAERVRVHMRANDWAHLPMHIGGEQTWQRKIEFLEHWMSKSITFTYLNWVDASALSEKSAFSELHNCSNLEHNWESSRSERAAAVARAAECRDGDNPITKVVILEMSKKLANYNSNISKI